MGMRQMSDGEADLNEFLQEVIDLDSTASCLLGETTYMRGGKWVEVTVKISDVEDLLYKRNALISIADAALNKATRHVWIRSSVEPGGKTDE